MRIFLLPLILVFELFAGIYDYDYKLQDTSINLVEKNIFMNGDFQEIIRFKMLLFKDGKLSEHSKHYENIVKKIKDYQDEGKSIRVTIIGHTDRPTDDKNEITINSKTYANKIQDMYRYSLSSDESDVLSKNYADNIKKMFIDENIPEKILYVENRKGDDISFTGATTQGRQLSNCVLVSIYVMK